VPTEQSGNAVLLFTVMIHFVLLHYLPNVTTLSNLYLHLPSCIQVCANGDLRANVWQEGASDEICELSIADHMVGASCNVIVKTMSSCGATDTFMGPQCKVDVDFPHSCFPGNTAWNGGRGTATTGLRGTPYQVVGAAASGTKISFSITNNECDSSLSTPMKAIPPNKCVLVGSLYF
jgi:hypothetical protein